MNPILAVERAKHKKKRLVQRPNSYFIDVKCVGKDCMSFSSQPHQQLIYFLLLFMWLKVTSLICTLPGCYRITTVFSHSQTVVLCSGCSLILCQPRGGKCRVTEGGKTRKFKKKKKSAGPSLYYTCDVEIFFSSIQAVLSEGSIPEEQAVQTHVG